MFATMIAFCVVLQDQDWNIQVNPLQGNIRKRPRWAVGKTSQSVQLLSVNFTISIHQNFRTISKESYE